MFQEWSTHFLGGGLIGLAAALLLIGNGRIAGISGIFSGMFAKGSEGTERILFVLGIVIAPTVYFLLSTGIEAPKISSEVWALITAGLLVGFGARLGSGCTSGHGICGIGRLSRRSIVAVGTFILTGVLTVTFLNFA